MLNFKSVFLRVFRLFLREVSLKIQYLPFKTGKLAPENVKLAFYRK